MSSPNHADAAAARALEDLEKAVFLRARAAGEELQRIDSLDDEQRAEIHAILEALRHERQSCASAGATWGAYVPVRSGAADARASLREHFVEMLGAISATLEESRRQAQQAPDPATGEKFRRRAREQLRDLELAERLLEILNE